MHPDSTNSFPAERIFNLHSDQFEPAALDLFRFQYANNSLYQRYCRAIRKSPGEINGLADIPFLPISFFKTNEVISTNFTPALVFESSGTTGSVNSKHFVKNASLYEESFLRGFRLVYGEITDYCILGLLPSYLERQHSSLVYMTERLIRESGNPDSGFYLYDFEKLQETILRNESTSQKTILLGVTYALLDFAEKYPMQLSHTIVMETGGMKGRGPELTRPEVHERCKQRFGINEVHSEYGMTELLSQAYAPGNGIFSCPPWMKVIARAEDDPFDLQVPGSFSKEKLTSAVNIIDLANIYSCAFIATDDAATFYNDGRYEILGRLDNSDLRGCSLLIV